VALTKTDDHWFSDGVDDLIAYINAEPIDDETHKV